MHAEEAVKDMGLDAEPFGAHRRRQEAAEVAVGVAPLLSVHELLQAAWAADEMASDSPSILHAAKHAKR